MRTAALLIASVLFALSCSQDAPRATPSLTASNLVEVSPPVGVKAAIGWDGIDGRMMLVTPVEDRDLHQVSLAAWTLNGDRWQPMAAPPLVSDERGLGPLTLAYDSDRHLEMLITSKSSGSQAAEIYEWNGRSWRLATTTHAPDDFANGAYSPELHALVGLGSYDQIAMSTWLYDGTDWRPAGDFRTTQYNQSRPSYIQYDPTRHAILGLDPFAFLTWKFDGTTWTAIQLRGPVPVRQSGHGFCCGAVTMDQHRGGWVMFGGNDGGDVVSADTWIGDTSSWTKASPPASPQARQFFSGSHLAWDPRNNRAVLFGGVNSGRQAPSTFSDTWAWEGKTWTKLSDAGPMAVQVSHMPSPCAASSSYGLLIAAGALQMIDTCGKIAARAPLAESSVLECTRGGAKATLATPVSASNDKVYFRDGATKIRSLGLDGHTEDVSTVPGSATTVSFFSVSPDDQRIAVVVEDLSSTSTIALRLYVEDLHGGGHHVDAYSTTVPKATGNTLWPMGWHQGSLVLAAMTACAPDPASLSPVKWSVVDPATANRRWLIPGLMPYRNVPCILGLWPSPAGITCVDFGGQATVYNWNAGQVDLFGVGFYNKDGGSGASPSGHRIFVVSQYGESRTEVVIGNGSTEPQHRQYAAGRYACLWIDEDHILAPDAIIGTPSPLFPDSGYAPVTPLASSGTCAGRFPGGL